MVKRIAISVVAVFVALMARGLVVHGMLLGPDYAQLVPAMFRSPQDSQKYFGFMIAADLLMAAGITWIYRAGRDGRPWLGQGLRFGMAIAVLMVIPGYLIYYAVQPMPGTLVVKQIVLDSAAMVLVAIVAAAVNRDAPPARA